jgi:hypothetical protein
MGHRHRENPFLLRPLGIMRMHDYFVWTLNCGPRRFGVSHLRWVPIGLVMSTHPPIQNFDWRRGEGQVQYDPMYPAEVRHMELVTNRKHGARRWAIIPIESYSHE